QVEVRPGDRALTASIRFPLVRALPAIVARLKRALDLDADLASIGEHLAQDELLAPLVALRPGLRIAGSWDPFETAVRAVVESGVSASVARRHLALVASLGTPIGDAVAFPTPDQLARIGELPLPAGRRETLAALAAAVRAEPRLLDGDPDALATRLRALRGLGD